MAEDYSGLVALAKNDVLNVRMEGLILQVLIERGLLTKQQARALVQDVVQHAAPEASIAQAYVALHDELQ